MIRAAPVLEAPVKPDGLSHRDYLIMLLHTAAELEHGLMVEYLYAAYSLGGPGAEKTDAIARKVAKWRDALLTIAREEMGHLLTVENALMLIGGPISFDRRAYPWTSRFYPFPFRLEPLSLKSLARYVYAEMSPSYVSNGPKAAAMLERLKIIDDMITNKVISGWRVGVVYEAILELAADRTKIPDSTFDTGSLKFQATWDEWGRGYRPEPHKPYAKNPEHPNDPPPYARKTRVIVASMATRTELLNALGDLASQGEGETRADDRAEPSHFDRFVEIFNEYSKLHGDDPHWSPTRPLPTNPVVDKHKEYLVEGTTEITAPESRHWASLFNLRYRILLSMLTYTYRVSREANPAADLRRAPMLARVFGEMYNLKAIAGVLVRLPLTDDPKSLLRAGPPFELGYSRTLPAPEANFWRLQLDLIDGSRELAEQLLQALPETNRPSDGDGARYLTALLEADNLSRTWIEKRLEGLAPGQGHKGKRP